MKHGQSGMKSSGSRIGKLCGRQRALSTLLLEGKSTMSHSSLFLQRSSERDSRHAGQITHKQIFASLKRRRIRSRVKVRLLVLTPYLAARAVAPSPVEALVLVEACCLGRLVRQSRGTQHLRLVACLCKLRNRSFTKCERHLEGLELIDPCDACSCL